jgi:hypothetical protein
MLGSLEINPMKAVKYKNKFYKSLYNLYQLNKTEETPSFETFRKKLLKTKSISLALKKSDKKIRTEYYQKLYQENKNEKSVSEALFIRRMRNGAKLSHALNRKESKILKSPITIDGYSFYSLTKLAQHFNLLPSTVITRYNRGLRGKRLIKSKKLCGLGDLEEI